MVKEKKENFKSKGVIKRLNENKLYIIIVFIVAIITFVCVYGSNKTLNNSEKIVYEVVNKNKNTFKNPESLKLVSAKVCSKDYLIIRITANNSFGAETTDDYYVNQNTLTTSDTVAEAVVKKCFEEEKNNYDNVVVLSNKSTKKINSKLGRK
jgi:uncharacterized pyridoxamine 5'-phosphate oxidase family protein